MKKVFRFSGMSVFVLIFHLNAPFVLANPILKAKEAAPHFNFFFNQVRECLKERDYLIDLAEISLISKEHLLMMGPPGNAKSMLADQILGNIVDKSTRKTSYFKIQMTPETTLSETHGPLDYKKLTEENRYERIYSAGMLYSRNGFIDEIFDARANALRNTLGLLNERAHAQGTQIETGKIETVFAATNHYISEVYEKSQDDRPKALLDRFAFSAFVPADFEFMDCAVQMLQSDHSTVRSKLTFQDLDDIRAVVDTVKIPDRIAEFLAVVRSQLKAQLESIEQSELKAYRDRIKNGEDAKPPYRATKYMSLRTLRKAGQILKAIVVQDWIKKEGSRPLAPDLESGDLLRLQSFFTLNGPSDSFLESQLADSSNPHERVQLEAILRERRIFRKIYEDTLKARNEVLVRYAVEQSLLHDEISRTKTSFVTKREMQKNFESLYDVEKKLEASKKLSQFTGETIGLMEVHQNLLQSFNSLGLAEYEFEETKKEAFKNYEEKLKSDLAKHVVQEQEELAKKQVDEEEAKRKIQKTQEEQDEREFKAKWEMELLRRQFIIHDNFSIQKLDLRRKPEINSSYFGWIPGTFQYSLFDAENKTFTLINLESGKREEFTKNDPHTLKNGAETLAKFLSVKSTGKDGKIAEFNPIDELIIPDKGTLIAKNHFLFFRFKKDKMGYVLADKTRVASHSDFKYAINQHRTSVVIVDKKLRKVREYNWETGSLTEIALNATVKSRVPNTKIQLFSDVVTQISHILFSTDPFKMYFASSSVTELYEFDIKKSEVTQIPSPIAAANSRKFHLTLADFSAETNKVYFYNPSRDRRDPLFIYEAKLDDPDSGIQHQINNLNYLVTDLKVIQDGQAALASTKEVGVILMDLIHHSVLDWNLLDLPSECHSLQRDEKNHSFSAWCRPNDRESLTLYQFTKTGSQADIY